jgi:hypothetical protein
MKRISDLDNNGKNLPYTTPDGFFDQLEDNVWEAVKGDFSDERSNAGDQPAAPAAKPALGRWSGWRILIGGAVAASVIMAIVFSLKPAEQDSYTIDDVDRAFSQLCTDDQTFLLSIYQNDVFINE